MTEWHVATLAQDQARPHLGPLRRIKGPCCARLRLLLPLVAGALGCQLLLRSPDLPRPPFINGDTGYFLSEVPREWLGPLVASPSPAASPLKW